MATSIYNYVELTGTIIPDTGDIEGEVAQEYKDAFGQDLITTPDTPQGVLIVGEVTARKSVADNNAALANQINPNLAGGVYLDAICALTGLQRQAGAPTLVPVNLTGIPNTVIPTTVTINFTTDDLFSPLTQITLDTNGEGTVILASLVNGPITVLNGATGQIVSGVLGLETVTASALSAPGTVLQSDISLRQERRETIGVQGTSQAAAITGAVYAVPNVQSLSYRENVKPFPQVIDGIPMTANSIFVCVNGGTDTAVATATASKKGGGCDYSAAVGVAVNITLVDPSSGQSYIVTFARPNLIQILAQVTVSIGTFTGDPVTAVKNAIVQYANGQLESEPGFVVGSSVSAFELAGAINQMAPGLFVKNLEIAVAGVSPVFSCDEIPITLYQIAQISAEQVTVIVI